MRKATVLVDRSVAGTLTEVEKGREDFILVDTLTPRAAPRSDRPVWRDGRARGRR